MTVIQKCLLEITGVFLLLTDWTGKSASTLILNVSHYSLGL